MKVQHIAKPKQIVLPQDVPDKSNKKKLGIAIRLNKEVTFEGLFSSNQIIYRNWMIDEMRAKFPALPAMWHVEKMVSLPNGKKLLIDEPVKEWEIKECDAKAPELKALGYLYIAIKPHTTLAEALVDAGVELG